MATPNSRMKAPISRSWLALGCRSPKPTVASDVNEK